jgi:hypothetical protein
MITITSIETVSLRDWVKQPPSIVVFRRGEQPLLDVNDAVVCFRSMHDARKFIGILRRSHRKRSKGLHPVECEFGPWLEVMKAEAAAGRTHLVVFQFSEDGIVQKRSTLITDVLNAIQEVLETHSDEFWRWN